MAINSGEECQNVHNVVVLTGEGATGLPSSHFSNISYAEVVPGLMKSEMRLSSEPNLQNHHTSLKADEVNNYVCILDINPEKGKDDVPKSMEDSASNLKTDDSFAVSLYKVLLREIGLQIGGKFMQFLMKHGAELPKFTSRDKILAERVHHTSTNRSRKYKRSVSFNSRRVVLLFSVLSSMGTIILICLTLRVRQMTDMSGKL